VPKRREDPRNKATMSFRIDKIGSLRSYSRLLRRRPRPRPKGYRSEREGQLTAKARMSFRINAISFVGYGLRFGLAKAGELSRRDQGFHNEPGMSFRINEVTFEMAPYSRFEAGRFQLTQYPALGGCALGCNTKLAHYRRAAPKGCAASGVSKN
jgi:hypothetical protein